MVQHKPTAINIFIENRKSSSEFRFKVESPLHLLKIGVWYAILRRIIRPLFFEITLNAEAYQDIVSQFITLLERLVPISDDAYIRIRILNVCECANTYLREGKLSSEYHCFEGHNSETKHFRTLE
ncbi:hypothetical protein ANN_11373 [Periplaneta americana]|uniref:Uncharacterized protein n=1 Tax=Periplaneta americana TaxID=6978 RepID=A0ABQ8T6M6_PERAM|nr:hypothetical protein ANN_11373 [Periplaneta americana]